MKSRSVHQIYCCMEVSVDGDTGDYRVKISPSAAELCVLDVADDPDTPATHYRLSETGDRIIYVSIDAGVYDEDDYCVPPVLLDLLPPFPSGDWNKGHITRTEERPEAHFAWTRVADLPAITPTWHPRHVEFNQLDICNKVMPNVAEASHPELGEVVAKYARFEWEIASYQSENEVYRWLDGHNMGPDFLGHLTESGRVIGLLLQKLNGRHAYFQDLARCEDVVRKPHSLDIVHGNLNRHNFLVNEEQVVLIDFETSVRSQDVDEKTEELRGLKKELLDHSGKGGQGKIRPSHIQKQLDEIYKRDDGWSEKLSRQADEGEITTTSEENKKLLEQMRAGRTAYVPV